MSGSRCDMVELPHSFRSCSSTIRQQDSSLLCMCWRHIYVAVEQFRRTVRSQIQHFCGGMQYKRDPTAKHIWNLLRHSFIIITKQIQTIDSTSKANRWQSLWCTVQTTSSIDGCDLTPWFCIGAIQKPLL